MEWRRAPAFGRGNAMKTGLKRVKIPDSLESHLYRVASRRAKPGDARRRSLRLCDSVAVICEIGAICGRCTFSVYEYESNGWTSRRPYNRKAPVISHRGFRYGNPVL